MSSVLYNTHAYFVISITKYFLFNKIWSTYRMTIRTFQHNHSRLVALTQPDVAEVPSAGAGH